MSKYLICDARGEESYRFSTIGWVGICPREEFAKVWNYT